MKSKTYKLTNSEISKCLLFGRFKWYRKRRGGTWVLVEGFPYYWINREPMYIEIALNQIYKIERYE
jgi:hypothetical protein